MISNIAIFAQTIVEEGTNTDLFMLLFCLVGFVFCLSLFVGSLDMETRHEKEQKFLAKQKSRSVVKEICNRFVNAIEVELGKLNPSVEVAMKLHVYKQLEEVKKTLESPAHLLWQKTDDVRFSRQWGSLIVFNSANWPKHDRLPKELSERLAFVLESAEFKKTQAALNKRLKNLISEWELWEAADASIMSLAASIEADPSYRTYKHLSADELILTSGTLLAHHETALGDSTLAQRMLWRKTLIAGPMFKALTGAEASNTRGQTHLMVASRPVLEYAYGKHKNWVVMSYDSTPVDGLDMEMFLMLWAKSSGVKLVQQVASATHALVRAERFSARTQVPAAQSV